MDQEINTIRAIVYSIILGRQEQTMDNYERYKQMIIEGVRDKLKLRTSFGIETMRGYADASSNGQITMPPDFAKTYKVGLNEGGHLWTLTYDRSLIIDGPPTCAESISSLPSVVPAEGLLFLPWTDGGIFYGPTFSAGGGVNEAYFKEDRNNGRIFIEPAIFHKEIIIEYVSVGKNLGDATVIPHPYVEPLKRFLPYQEESYMNPGSAKQEQLKRAFDIAMKETKPVVSDLTYSRIADQSNQNSFDGVKRP